jgi:hypothetical protein
MPKVPPLDLCAWKNPKSPPRPQPSRFAITSTTSPVLKQRYGRKWFERNASLCPLHSCVLLKKQYVCFWRHNNSRLLPFSRSPVFPCHCFVGFYDIRRGRQGHRCGERPEVTPDIKRKNRVGCVSSHSGGLHGLPQEDYRSSRHPWNTLRSPHGGHHMFSRGVCHC